MNELGRAAIMGLGHSGDPGAALPYDVWAASDVVTLVSEARQFKPNLDAVFVINRKIVNTAIGRDVAGALADFNIPVSDHALHQRVVYAESAARGLGVIAL